MTIGILAYDFFRNAVIASLVASVACGIIGSFVVVKRLVSMSGGLSHAAFGGIGLGYLLGVDPHQATGHYVQGHRVLRGQYADIRHYRNIAPGHAVAVRGYIEEEVEESHPFLLSFYCAQGILGHPLHKGRHLYKPVEVQGMSRAEAQALAAACAEIIVDG